MKRERFTYAAKKEIILDWKKCKEQNPNYQQIDHVKKYNLKKQTFSEWLLKENQIMEKAGDGCMADRSVHGLKSAIVDHVRSNIFKVSAKQLFHWIETNHAEYFQDMKNKPIKMQNCRRIVAAVEKKMDTRKTS